MVAFFDELKTLGFVEGQNLKIVAGGFELRNDQYAEVAATLPKAAPDVVFCVSDAATRAAGKSAPTLPIVGLSDDMLAAGFVRSFSHPGGNITGVSILGADLNGKRLEVLMEAVPSCLTWSACHHAESVDASRLLRSRDRHWAANFAVMHGASCAKRC
jgi:putative ABC transport system substrate-binding protein